MTPRVMGSEVLPAARRFSKVVLRVPDRFLQGFQLCLVLLLDQRRQPDAGHRFGLGAGIASALHLFAENPWPIRSPAVARSRSGKDRLAQLAAKRWTTCRSRHGR